VSFIFVTLAMGGKCIKNLCKVKCCTKDACQIKFLKSVILNLTADEINVTVFEILFTCK